MFSLLLLLYSPTACSSGWSTSLIFQTLGIVFVPLILFHKNIESFSKHIVLIAYSLTREKRPLRYEMLIWKDNYEFMSCSFSYLILYESGYNVSIHIFIKFLVHFVHVWVLLLLLLLLLCLSCLNGCHIPQVTIGIRKYLDNTKLKANAISKLSVFRSIQLAWCAIFSANTYTQITWRKQIVNKRINTVPVVCFSGIKNFAPVE